MTEADFRARYGPWALVAGASEGIGEAFAAELAARGLNLLLLARREAPLRALAEKLSAAHGVEARAAALDLSRADLADALAEVSAGLEIGLFVYNAALSRIGPFLEQPLEDKLRIVDTNCRGPLVAAHLFGAPMAARGRGGIVLMSSLSGLQGSPWIATYAATKAFNLALGEALWDELRARGVDALVCCAGATRTPGYLASAPKKAGPVSAPEMEAAAVAREALAALGRRPSMIPGAANRAAAFLMSRLLPRRAAVAIMGKTARAMYAEKIGAPRT